MESFFLLVATVPLALASVTWGLCGCPACDTPDAAHHAALRLCHATVRCCGTRDPCSCTPCLAHRVEKRTVRVEKHTVRVDKRTVQGPATAQL